MFRLVGAEGRSILAFLARAGNEDGLGSCAEGSVEHSGCRDLLLF